MNTCSLQLWDHFPNLGCFFFPKFTSPQPFLILDLYGSRYGFLLQSYGLGMGCFDHQYINPSLERGVWILRKQTLPTNPGPFKQPRLVQIRFPNIRPGHVCHWQVLKVVVKRSWCPATFRWSPVFAVPRKEGCGPRRNSCFATEKALEVEGGTCSVVVHVNYYINCSIFWCRLFLLVFFSFWLLLWLLLLLR